MNKNLIAAAMLATTLALGACSDADVVSENISTQADSFQIQRRVVFFNGITDKYLFTIEGRCAIEADNIDGQLEVTCKTGEDSYKKHFLGLSDNVSYMVEQIDGARVSKNHYKVVFKPTTLLPEPEIR